MYYRGRVFSDTVYRMDLLKSAYISAEYLRCIQNKRNAILGSVTLDQSVELAQ